MDNERIEAIMTGLGFSLYEARAYRALVADNPLTGYELAGKAGVPRSKIYESIERLSRKGLAVQVDGNPARYAPMPPAELVERLRSEMTSSLDTLGELLRETSAADGVDYIFNIPGRDGIMARAREMVRASTERLDLSLWPEESAVLLPDMEDAAGRDVAVRLISFGECGFSGGEVYRHRLIGPVPGDERWITIVRDGCEVLTGSCTGNGSSVAAWTRNRSLVFVSLRYIEHEIMRIRETSNS